MNVHIYPSTIENESRMLKITRSLADAKIFSSIEIIGRWKPGLALREDLGEGVCIVRIKPVKLDFLGTKLSKIVAVASWYFKTIIYLLPKNLECVNPHSLPVLPLAVALKLTKDTKLVYDTHELETETLTCKGVKRKLFKLTEKLFLRFSDEIVVVNNSIAEWYAENYHIKKPWVVRNVPKASNEPATNYLREKFAIPNDKLVFIYQGLISRGRGVETILEAFKKTPIHHVVFLGYGEKSNLVQDAAAKSDNIHFLPAVPPNQVQTITSSADVGISLIENVCLSYYLSLPNKLFEYVTSGVPVLASDFPEMKSFISLHKSGWTVNPDIRGLTDYLNKINVFEVRTIQQALKAHPVVISWKDEEPQLFNLYKNLGF